MVLNRINDEANQIENIIKKNQIELERLKNDSINPPSVKNIIKRSKAENIIIFVPARFSRVKTIYDNIKKVVHNFGTIPNSTFQHNSPKNKTSANWITYFPI